MRENFRRNENNQNVWKIHAIQSKRKHSFPNWLHGHSLRVSVGLRNVQVLSGSRRTSGPKGIRYIFSWESTSVSSYENHKGLGGCCLISKLNNRRSARRGRTRRGAARHRTWDSWKVKKFRKLWRWRSPSRSSIPNGMQYTTCHADQKPTNSQKSTHTHLLAWEGTKQQVTEDENKPKRSEHRFSLVVSFYHYRAQHSTFCRLEAGRKRNRKAQMIDSISVPRYSFIPRIRALMWRIREPGNGMRMRKSCEKRDLCFNCVPNEYRKW